MNMKCNKGFTLIEIMVVVAILSILASIGFFMTADTVETVEENVCYIQQNEIINLYTLYAVDGEEQEMHNLVGMEFLVESGLLKEEYYCPVGGSYIWHVDGDENVSVTCSIHNTTDLNTGFSFDGVGFFSINDFTFSDSKNNSWEIIEINGRSVLVNGDKSKSRIFFENTFESYSLETNVRVLDGKGYGVFIESSTNGKGNDTGYILQFDPGKGKGEIVIKRRENGSSINKDTLLKLTSSDLINLGLGENWDKKDSTSNWYSSHSLNIVVDDLNNGTKSLNVFMDGVKLNEDVLFIDSNESDNNNIGYRSWVNNNKSDINVYDLSLENLD